MMSPSRHSVALSFNYPTNQPTESHSVTLACQQSLQKGSGHNIRLMTSSVQLGLSPNAASLRKASVVMQQRYIWQTNTYARKKETHYDGHWHGAQCYRSRLDHHVSTNIRHLLSASKCQERC